MPKSMTLRLTKKQSDFIVLNQVVTEKGFGVCDSVSSFSHGPGIGTEDWDFSPKREQSLKVTSPRDRPSRTVQSTSDIPWADF